MFRRCADEYMTSLVVLTLVVRLILLPLSLLNQNLEQYTALLRSIFIAQVVKYPWTKE